MDMITLQSKIKKLVDTINLQHRHPQPELISYIGEITQLLITNQITTRKNKKQSKQDIKADLGDEIADSIIALISLANDFNINIQSHIIKKLAIHNIRTKQYKNTI